MNAKYLWLVLISLVFFGCDDDTGGLGLGMLPDTDEITVSSAKFGFKTKSAKFEDGKIYAKTALGYVGRFTDNEYGFGYYEGSYLTELNCVDDLTFPKPYDRLSNKSQTNMVSEDLDESIVSVSVVLGYYSFYGDSLSPMQVSVYELDHNLNKSDLYYTDIDPTKYYDTTKPALGKKTFSAVDQADPDRNTSGYMHSVTIPLSKEIGKRFIQRNWEHPEDFRDSEAFREFFKGLYVTSEIGSGTVLYVQHTQLVIEYNGFVLDSLGNTINKHNSDIDSTYVGSRVFASTMEVFQSNQIEIEQSKIDEKVNEGDHTYLKSPAGIYTTAVLPINEIVQNLNLEKDTINAVRLTLEAYHHEKVNEYSMDAPSSILLIREKEIEEFFETNQLYNNTTSYTATLSNNQYAFTNITRLVNTYIKEMNEAKAEADKNNESWNEAQWLEENPIAFIPVYLDASSGSVTNVQHNMQPTYVRLKGGPNSPDLDLQVIYTTFK